MSVTIRVMTLRRLLAKDLARVDGGVFDETVLPDEYPCDLEEQMLVSEDTNSGTKSIGQIGRSGTSYV